MVATGPLTRFRELNMITKPEFQLGQFVRIAGEDKIGRVFDLKDPDLVGIMYGGQETTVYVIRNIVDSVNMSSKEKLSAMIEEVSDLVDVLGKEVH